MFAWGDETGLGSLAPSGDFGLFVLHSNMVCMWTLTRKHKKCFDLGKKVKVKKREGGKRSGNWDNCLGWFQGFESLKMDYFIYS